MVTVNGTRWMRLLVVSSTLRYVVAYDHDLECWDVGKEVVFRVDGNKPLSPRHSARFPSLGKVLC
jgi:hypothetical protein